jgi:hypothetical protein
VENGVAAAPTDDATAFDPRRKAGHSTTLSDRAETLISLSSKCFYCTNWSGLDLAPTGGHKMPTGGQNEYKVAFLEPRRPPGAPHTRVDAPHTACVHMRVVVGYSDV